MAISAPPPAPPAPATPPPPAPQPRRAGRAVWVGLVVVVVVGVCVAINHFGWQRTGWLDDVIGTAGPETYALQQTTCETGLDELLAEGTLRNTTDVSRSFAIRVRFHRGGTVAGAGFAVASNVAPGDEGEWRVADSEPGGSPKGKLGCQVLVDEFP